MRHNHGSGIRKKKTLSGQGRLSPADGGATSHSAVGGTQIEMFFEKNLKQK
jgi:hypothetical protein